MSTAAGTGPGNHKITVLEIAIYIISSTVIIFYLDASTPLGLMVWILYFIPLFLTIYLRWKYAPFLTTGVIILLLAASYFISPRDMSEFFALMNRAFFTIMLLVVSVFIWNYHRSVEDLWITEERYRFLAECSSDAILVYRGGKILYANLSSLRLLGAEKKEDLLGKDIVGQFDPGDQPLIRQKIEQSVMGVRMVLDRIKVVQLNGTAILAQVSLGKVLWDGEPALLASIRAVGTA